MPKTHDLCVKVGTYTDKGGNEKARYENIGAVITKDDGGEFIMLKRTFNPAGVPNPDNKDMVIVSLFMPQDKSNGNDGQQARQQPQQSQSRLSQQSSSGGGGNFNEFEDDIPF